MRARGITDLTGGPGRLATALDIDDGVDLCADGPLWLGASVRDARNVRTSVPIAITRDVDRPLRFFEAGSPFVSGACLHFHLVLLGFSGPDVRWD